MKFTIDVERWLRGEGTVASRLLRSSDGKMCCMGQVCLQLGVPESEIRDERGLGADQAKLLGTSRVGRPIADWIYDAYEENDAAADRTRLREIFARGGHELVFSDEQQAR